MSDQVLSVHMLLDNSGSMEWLDEAVIKAFNEFLGQLQLAVLPPKLTVDLFNDRRKKIITNRPVYEIPPMTAEQYQAWGGTALVHSIEAAVRELEASPSTHKVLIVLTDGQDGCPTERVAKTLKKKQADGWLVIFLATDQDATEAGTNLGVNRDMILDFSGSKMRETMAAAASAVLRFNDRRDAKEAAFTAEERKKAR